MFKTTLAKAIQIANVVEINSYKIDDYSGFFLSDSNEYVLSCELVMNFQFKDQEVEIDHGLCTAIGQTQEVHADWGDPDKLTFCFKVERLLIEEDMDIEF